MVYLLSLFPCLFSHAKTPLLGLNYSSSLFFHKRVFELHCCPRQSIRKSQTSIPRFFFQHVNGVNLLSIKTPYLDAFGKFQLLIWAYRSGPVSQAIHVIRSCVHLILLRITKKNYFYCTRLCITFGQISATGEKRKYAKLIRIF